MPTSRKFVKRDLTQCLVRLQGIQDYLTRSGRLYEPNNPEIYQMFCLLMALTDQLETGLKSLHGHL